MFKRVETNDCEIRINAKSAGDFGFVRIGGMERTPKEEYRACEEILSQIKRHVDGVGWTDIQQGFMYQTDDGEEFEFLYDVLAHLYDEDGSLPYYSYRYQHPNENYGSSGILNDFKDVITMAWNHPWNFELRFDSTLLTEEQQSFLDNVITASLKEKTPAEVK